MLSVAAEMPLAQRRIRPEPVARRRADSGVYESPDASLVEAARGGDRRAEDALARRHLAEVAGVVRRLLGSREDADDVVQDAFAIAFEQLARLREPAAFRGWLFSIAVNRVRRTIRRRRLQRTLGLDRTAEAGVLDAFADERVRPEVRAELWLLDTRLAALGANERIAWMLRHVEGEPLVDVARLCGCSLATAKRRIAAANARIGVDVAAEEEFRS